MLLDLLDMAFNQHGSKSNIFRSITEPMFATLPSSIAKRSNRMHGCPPSAGTGAPAASKKSTAAVLTSVLTLNLQTPSPIEAWTCESGKPDAPCIARRVVWSRAKLPPVFDGWVWGDSSCAARLTTASKRARRVRSKRGSGLAYRPCTFPTVTARMSALVLDRKSGTFCW